MNIQVVQSIGLILAVSGIGWVGSANAENATNYPDSMCAQLVSTRCGEMDRHVMSVSEEFLLLADRGTRVERMLLHSEYPHEDGIQKGTEAESGYELPMQDNQFAMQTGKTTADSSSQAEDDHTVPGSLLASILALIGIVAVARRNVTGRNKSINEDSAEGLKKSIDRHHSPRDRNHEPNDQVPISSHANSSGVPYIDRYHTGSSIDR